MQGIKDVSATYAESLDYLYRRIDYEKIGHAPYTANHYRLDRMRQLLDLLGNPHERYKIVHVAGTKGKGTVSNLIAGCLSACGYRTGLYTSPHLLRLEERFWFNGQIATADQVISLTHRIRLADSKLDQMNAGKATFFELTTAMAMLFFADQEADCAVLEVGLGGRLDSTNVCSPAVSVITSISLDHQKQLGNTVAEIASEKAGIIKQKTPVVCSARDPAARQVIISRAASQCAALRLIDRDFSASWRRVSTPLRTEIPHYDAVSDQPATDTTFAAQSDPLPPTAEVVFTQLTFEPGNQDSERADLQPEPAAKRSNWNLSTWPTHMLGSHQAENIAAAVATLELLAHSGWHKLDLTRAQAALAASAPTARMQVVSRQPLCIIDTAHNPASIQVGLTTLAEHFSERSPVILFASSHDKDYKQMLRRLLPNCATIVLTSYCNNPRALPLNELLKSAVQLASELKCESTIVAAQTPQSAWHKALDLMSPESLLYATGSFFLAAELLACSDLASKP